MNGTILSLFLALLMMFGSGETSPESARTLTLSDFEMVVSEEDISLTAPEFSLTIARNGEERMIHSEIGLNDEVFLPFTLKTDENEALAALSDSGNVYKTILEDVADMYFYSDEESVTQGRDTLMNLMESLRTIYGEITDVSSDNYATNLSERVNEILRLANAGEGAETTMEIDGESYPAMAYGLEWTPESAPAFLDAMRQSHVKSLHDLSESLLNLVSQIGGVEYTSFSELADMEDEEEITIPITILMAGAEDHLFITLEFEIRDDYWGTTQGVVFQYAFADSEAEMTMEMLETDDEYPDESSVSLEGTISESGLNFNLVVREYSETEYSSENDDGTSTDYLNLYDNTLLCSLFFDESETESAFNVNAGMQAIVEMKENGETVELSEEPLTTLFDFTVYTDYLDENSKHHAVTLERDPETADITYVSFELDDSMDTVRDYFGGLNVVPVSNDSEGDSDVHLMEDLSAVQQDLLALHENEEMAMILDFFGMDLETVQEMTPSQNVDPVEEPDPDAASSTEYPANYDPETDDAVYVDNWEEAALIFQGTLPEFTAPAEYECTQIEVNSYCVKAYYTDGTNEFTLYKNTFADGSSDYYTLENGELKNADQVLEINHYSDGEVYSITCTASLEEIVLYFETSYDEPMALEILEGLSIN